MQYTMKIKVNIIDDHPLAVKGITAMLAGHSHIDITGTYHSYQQLAEGLKKQAPDILLLDILLPDKSGKEIAPLIRDQYPEIGIIALTSLDAPTIIKSMMRRGCMGYLLKETDEATLLEAISKVHQGGEFIEPSLKEQMLQNILKGKEQTSGCYPELTRREVEILKLIVAEYTTQEISERLYVSFRTVEFHRFNLLKKLDVKNSVGLVKAALAMGLVKL